MAVSLSTVAAKDGTGTTIAGGLQAQDKSGAGTGPFTLAHVLIDGVAGTLMAQVTAANALKVDGSAVTQPVSLTSTTITGSVTVAQATAASLNATVVGTGTFAVQAAQSGTWNITNVSGTVSLPTGAATSALQPTNAAIGSTTSGQTGPLVQGAVTTSVPTYTTAQTNPLSLDTSGRLRSASWITDGTNIAAVKAASTTPLATDPAFVVSLSPNSAGIIGTGTQAAPSANYLSSVVAGDIAAAATDSGNPVKIGGLALTANPTAVTTGQRVNALFDKLGKQIVVGAIRTLKGVQDTTITASTSETTVVTAVASTFLDLYGIVLANSSATATSVTIKDATAGTTRAVIYVPAGDTRGFMLPVDSAIPQAAVNNNWTVTSSASITSLFVTALYVQNL